MKLLNQFGKSVSSNITFTAVLLIGGMVPLAAVATEHFEGVATLCAIDQAVIDGAEQKGNKGVLVQNDMGFIYYFQADDPDSLMNGWEDQTNNWKKTRKDVEFYWGHTTFIPEGYEATGTLEEDFKFKSEVILTGYSGTLKGTGALESVTVDFDLSPPNAMPVSEFPPECWGFQAVCGDCTCYPAISPGPDNTPGTADDVFTQYDISGLIHGYESE